MIFHSYVSLPEGTDIHVLMSVIFVMINSDLYFTMLMFQRKKQEQQEQKGTGWLNIPAMFVDL